MRLWISKEKSFRSPHLQLPLNTFFVVIYQGIQSVWFLYSRFQFELMMMEVQERPVQTTVMQAFLWSSLNFGKDSTNVVFFISISSLSFLTTRKGCTFGWCMRSQKSPVVIFEEILKVLRTSLTSWRAYEMKKSSLCSSSDSNVRVGSAGLLYVTIVAYNSVNWTEDKKCVKDCCLPFCIIF